MEKYFCDGAGCGVELTTLPQIECFHTSRGIVGKHRHVEFSIDVCMMANNGEPVQLCKKCRNETLRYGFDDLICNLKSGNSSNIKWT